MSKRETARVAAYVIYKKGTQILMSRRFNTGHQDGNYSFVAGHVEQSESPTEAAVREAMEESGVVVDSKDLELIQVMHRASISGLVYVDYIFITEKWKGEITNLEPEKCDALTWFDLKELPINTVPYVKSALEHWQSNKGMLHEYGWSECRDAVRSRAA